jgi:hypothetical protein
MVAARGCTTAAQLVATNPNTTTFARLAGAAGLLEGPLKDTSSRFMLFAPDDIAFDSFFEGGQLRGVCCHL